VVDLWAFWRLNLVARAHPPARAHTTARDCDGTEGEQAVLSSFHVVRECPLNRMSTKDVFAIIVANTARRLMVL
jgi:hypothetical protein